MRIPYRWRPSLGFVWLVTVAVAGVGFLAWGLRTPVLEEVWQMDIELRIGERPPLGRGELRRLRSALRAHPELAEFLIEDKHAGIFSANRAGQIEGGYAYLVRPDARAPGFLEVSYAGVDRDTEINIRARSAGDEAAATIGPGLPFAWRLPDDEPFPQLIEIRLEPRAGQTGRHPVQIDLRSGP